MQATVIDDDGSTTGTETMEGLVPPSPSQPPRELFDAGAPAHGRDDVRAPTKGKAAPPVLKPPAAAEVAQAAQAAIQAAEAAAKASMRKVATNVVQHEHAAGKNAADVDRAIEQAVAKERDVSRRAVERAIHETTMAMDRKLQEHVASEIKQQQRLEAALGGVVREKEALQRQVEELQAAALLAPQAKGGAEATTAELADREAEAANLVALRALLSQRDAQIDQLNRRYAWVLSTPCVRRALYLA